VFLNIAKAWELSNQETQKLLGDADLERISYVFGIYKALRNIFPSENQANSWVKKPNQAFGGITDARWPTVSGSALP